MGVVSGIQSTTSGIDLNDTLTTNASALIKNFNDSGTPVDGKYAVVFFGELANEGKE